MSHVEVTDEWLYKYIPIVDSAMIRALESEVDTSYEFSEEYERKMEKVIQKEAKMWVEDFFRFVRKAAVVAICILGALFALTMSVEAYRNKFFQTVKEIWEDSVIYTYFSEVEEESFQEKEPTYVPEGYEEIKRIGAEDLLTLVYENSAEQRIVWDRVLVSNEKYSVIDSECDTQVIKELEDGVAVVSLYSDGYIIARYEEEKYVYIVYTCELPLEEVYYMLENMQYVE